MEGSGRGSAAPAGGVVGGWPSCTWAAGTFADLAYESQRDERATRLISKAQKIRRHLGGSASLLEPFPPKPKGMHWRTYARLSLQSRRAGDAGLLVALAQLEHTPARIGSGIAPRGGRLEGSHRAGL